MPVTKILTAERGLNRPVGTWETVATRAGAVEGGEQNAKVRMITVSCGGSGICSSPRSPRAALRCPPEGNAREPFFVGS